MTTQNFIYYIPLVSALKKKECLCTGFENTLYVTPSHFEMLGLLYQKSYFH